MEKKDDKWLSTSEAGHILGVSPSWIVKLCKDDKLLCKMIGKRWQVDRISLIAYSESDRKPGPKPPYTPDKSLTKAINDSSTDYEVPQTLDITVRLEAGQIDHLLAKYGNVSDGLVKLVQDDMGISD